MKEAGRLEDKQAIAALTTESFTASSILVQGFKKKDKRQVTQDVSEPQVPPTLWVFQPQLPTSCEKPQSQATQISQGVTPVNVMYTENNKHEGLSEN